MEKTKEFLNKSRSLEGEAKKYYEDRAEVTIGEIQSVINQGKIIPKGEVKVSEIDKIIEDVEKDISREGERIWLT